MKKTKLNETTNYNDDYTIKESGFIRRVTSSHSHEHRALADSLMETKLGITTY